MYIMASEKKGILYVGMARNLAKRIVHHKNGSGSDFVKKYNVWKLVYFEKCESKEKAMLRERQLKHWHREWKIKLIEKNNPEWKDLFSIL